MYKRGGKCADQSCISKFPFIKMHELSTNKFSKPASPDTLGKVLLEYSAASSQSLSTRTTTL